MSAYSLAILGTDNTAQLEFITLYRSIFQDGTTVSGDLMETLDATLDEAKQIMKDRGWTHYASGPQSYNLYRRRQ